MGWICIITTRRKGFMTKKILVLHTGGNHFHAGWFCLWGSSPMLITLWTMWPFRLCDWDGSHWLLIFPVHITPQHMLKLYKNKANDQFGGVGYHGTDNLGETAFTDTWRSCRTFRSFLTGACSSMSWGATVSITTWQTSVVASDEKPVIKARLSLGECDEAHAAAQNPRPIRPMSAPFQTPTHGPLGDYETGDYF